MTFTRASAVFRRRLRRVPPTERLVQAFAEYMSDELHRRDSTVTQYLYRLKFISEWTGKPVTEITADDLRRFKKEAEYSSSHIKSTIVACRQFHSWGALEGYWKTGPLAKVRVPPEENRETGPLPHDVIAQLLDSVDGSLETRVVYMGLYAGLRVGESAAITEADWQDRWLLFRGEKTRKMREVPVHAALEAKRDAILECPSPHKSSLQKAKERVEERAGVSFVAHQLRKSFSTALHDHGVSSLCRKVLLGHATGLDGVYTQVSRKEKVAAIDFLDFGHESALEYVRVRPGRLKDAVDRLTYVETDAKDD